MAGLLINNDDWKVAVFAYLYSLFGDSKGSINETYLKKIPPFRTAFLMWWAREDLNLHVLLH